MHVIFNPLAGTGLENCTEASPLMSALACNATGSGRKTLSHRCNMHHGIASLGAVLWEHLRPKTLPEAEATWQFSPPCTSPPSAYLSHGLQPPMASPSPCGLPEAAVLGKIQSLKPELMICAGLNLSDCISVGRVPWLRDSTLLRGGGGPRDRVWGMTHSDGCSITCI